jgi:hypothetical protein
MKFTVLCMNRFGRSKLQWSPEASISRSTARCQRAKLYASSGARQTDSLTMRLTPAALATRTRLSSGVTVFESRKAVSIPARAGAIVSGRSRSRGRASTPGASGLRFR